MNKGISIINLIYNNIKISNGINYQELLLRKCLDNIKLALNVTEYDHEKRLNITKKYLMVLRQMIVDSERNGTGRIKAHSALSKQKILKLRLNSYFRGVPDQFLLFYANTTIWELKELISQHIKKGLKYIRFSYRNHHEIPDIDNGKTLQELKVIFIHFILLIISLKIWRK